MRLAEVEQGGAGAELGLDSEEFCDGTHTNMVLAGLDVLCRSARATSLTSGSRWRRPSSLSTSASSPPSRPALNWSTSKKDSNAEEGQMCPRSPEH